MCLQGLRQKLRIDDEPSIQTNFSSINPIMSPFPSAKACEECVESKHLASGWRAVAFSTAAMYMGCSKWRPAPLHLCWPIFGQDSLLTLSQTLSAHIPKTKAVDLHPRQVCLKKEGKFQQTFLDLIAHLHLKSGAGVSTNSLSGVRHGYPNSRASTTVGCRKDDSD